MEPGVSGSAAPLRIGLPSTVAVQLAAPTGGAEVSGAPPDWGSQQLKDASGALKLCASGENCELFCGIAMEVPPLAGSADGGATSFVTPGRGVYQPSSTAPSSQSYLTCQGVR